MGTYGYCAPEYAMTGKLTLKADVYSFGVVFLELISGHKAIDDTRVAGETNLVAWDLQVKAAPPAQTTTLHNDPAIIQSHFSRLISAPISSSSGGSGTVADLISHTAELGLPRSTFPSGLPLYQPGGGIGSWVPPQPPLNACGSGLAMPMYWQGFYSPSGGLPHLQQSPLLHPSMPQPFQ